MDFRAGPVNAASVPDNKAKRVLLVRLGSLGDIIHGLPALATLKTHLPAWEFDWLVERRWRELLRDNPFLSRVMEFDTLRWRKMPLARATWAEFLTAASRLRQRQYDCAIDLQGAVKSAAACRLSGAARILGFDRVWLREPAAGVFYTRRVAPAAAHVVEANLALAAALGAQPPVIAFPLPPGDPAAVPPELLCGEVALINPGAGWTAKQWPAHRYAEVCEALESRHSLRVVINCGPGEAALAEEVRSRCRRARPAAYSGSLAGLIALLRRSRLMIAPDTGPLHLAAALGVPTVALFGPTDPCRNGPYGNRHRILRSANALTSYRRSKGWPGGMEDIEVRDVLEAAEELLETESPRKSPPTVWPQPMTPAGDTSNPCLINTQG